MDVVARKAFLGLFASKRCHSIAFGLILMSFLREGGGSQLRMLLLTDFSSHMCGSLRSWVFLFRVWTVFVGYVQQWKVTIARRQDVRQSND